MICKYCGTDNRDSAKFCENCGAAIVAEETTPAPETINVENTVNDMPPTPQAYQPYQSPVNNGGYQPYDPNAYRPYEYNTMPMETTPPANGLAIASLICGILSLVCCGLPAGVLAIVFGIIAKSQGNKSGMSTAGIVCGAIGLVLALVLVVLMFASAFSADMYMDMY